MLLFQSGDKEIERENGELVPFSIGAMHWWKRLHM